MSEDDPFGGHEFLYEPASDLFRCSVCRQYEIVARTGGGPVKPCPGPVAGEPMTLNAY